jgi:hypothetical protein
MLLVYIRTACPMRRGEQRRDSEVKNISLINTTKPFSHTSARPRWRAGDATQQQLDSVHSWDCTLDEHNHAFLLLVSTRKRFSILKPIRPSGARGGWCRARDPCHRRRRTCQRAAPCERQQTSFRRTELLVIELDVLDAEELVVL